MAESLEQVRPLAPALIVNTVQHNTEGTTADPVLTYSPDI